MHALMVLKCEKKIYFFKEIYNCITLSLSKSKNKKHMQVKHLTFRMFQKTVALKFWITWTPWKTYLTSLAQNFIPMKLTGLFADKRSYMHPFLTSSFAHVLFLTA